MSFRHRVIAAALFALAGTRLAAAAEPRAGTLELDPAKTRIEFRVATALHTIHGTFHLDRGIITADPRDGAATGAITVDAASGDSGLGARDNRMKDSILESDKFPQIVFTPRHCDVQMESDGEFRVSLQGVMTLHGSEHQIVLDAEGHLSGDEIVATCHFSIPYVEWGMKDPSLLLLTVAKDVEINVATTGTVVWTGDVRHEQ